MVTELAVGVSILLGGAGIVYSMVLAHRRGIRRAQAEPAVLYIHSLKRTVATLIATAIIPAAIVGWGSSTGAGTEVFFVGLGLIFCGLAASVVGPQLRVGAITLDGSVLHHREPGIDTRITLDKDTVTRLRQLPQHNGNTVTAIATVQSEERHIAWLVSLPDGMSVPMAGYDYPELPHTDSGGWELYERVVSVVAS